MSAKSLLNPSVVTNSLFVAGADAVLSAIAFAAFAVPRFTEWGLLFCPPILVLFAVDVLLVFRDLWRSGTRIRALGAVVLWLPVGFLFGMIPQWEGPLYIAVTGDPPTFEMRGLAMFCDLEIYGPEQDQAEWHDDDIGLVWSIGHSPQHFPYSAKFAYGTVPSRFVQTFPANNQSPRPLDPTVTYKIVAGPCMGLPRYLSLRGNQLMDYKPNPAICWGKLKVPERKNSAVVRVDCKTRQPLPMSERAKQRLEAYRQNRLSFY